jgi:hypothetical protein
MLRPGARVVDAGAGFGDCAALHEGFEGNLSGFFLDVARGCVGACDPSVCGPRDGGIARRLRGTDATPHRNRRTMPDAAKRRETQ